MGVGMPRPIHSWRFTLSMFRSSHFLSLLAAGLIVGCGSGGSSSINAGPANGSSFGQASPGQISARETVLVSVEQAALAQGLGGLLSMARFAAPSLTGFRTFDPSIEVPINGDYVLTRTPLAGGNFRLDIYNPGKTKLLASAIAEPAVASGNGFLVNLTLGDERFSETGPTQNQSATYPFFGLIGRATLRFDSLGQLLDIQLANVEMFGRRLQFSAVSGTLTRQGDHMLGNLNYGLNARGLSIDALYDTAGAFGGLEMASELFGGQGRAFLDRNFNQNGIFSPLNDPVFSSPLVPAQLGSLPAPNNSRFVSYTVVDGIFTVFTPPVPPATTSGAQSFDLFSAQPLQGGFLPVALPAGARLIVSTTPSSPVTLGTRLALKVYAVNSSGKPVPFNTNGFELTSSQPQVARVSGGFQVEAVGEGTTTLTLNDPASGQSGSVQLTVGGAGATGTGFLYLADLGNSRLVRFRFNPASPGLPDQRTEILTGHSPLRILISRDKSTLMAENTDNTLQIFSIDQSSGVLTQRSADTLSVTGLAQGQVDPSMYYGNSGSPNQIKEFHFNSSNGRLEFVRNLRQGASSRLVTGLIGGGQYVYGSFQNTIHSVDVAAATSRDVTMGAGEFVSDLAVTRLNSGADSLQVLLRRSLGGGAFEGVLRSFPLNADGTLNTPASRNITVQSDASGLAINNERAYNGAFANGTTVNGVQLSLTSLNHLPGQPYVVSGTPTTLATLGNLLFIGTNPEGKLETLRIGNDGSLSTLGAVDVGGNATDLEAVVLP